MTAYRPGARWQPRVLSPGQVLLALIENTLVARSRPEMTLKVLARTVRGARALKSRRDEAEELAAMLLSNESAKTSDGERRRRRTAEREVV